MIASEKKYLPGRWKWKEICLLNWVQTYMYSLEEERVQYDEDKKIFIIDQMINWLVVQCVMKNVIFIPVIVLRQGV